MAMLGSVNERGYEGGDENVTMPRPCPHTNHTPQSLHHSATIMTDPQDKPKGSSLDDIFGEIDETLAGEDNGKMRT